MPSISDLETPALLVDLDRLERNIADMATVAKAGGKNLRPHTKTHKCIEIARMQVEAGACGLTVAKLGEAEVFADAGFDDIFVANQVVGHTKVNRLIELARRITLRVGADSQEVTEPIALAAERAGIRVPVRIEVDTGLGRAGTRSVEEAVSLAKFVAVQPGVELDGLFTHEGHLYREPDAGKCAILAAEVAARMQEVASALRSAGLAVATVSVGSTPGAAAMAGADGPSEIRPGVYVFNDRTQIRLGLDPDRAALTVLAIITSVRSDGRVIVDAGSKSLASDSNFPDKTCGELVAPGRLPLIGMSEEHGHLQADPGHKLKVGQRVRIIPNHACTCVNMHDTMFALRGDHVVETWRVAARGKIQ